MLPSLVLIIPMPHKHNAARRHHIPRMSFKVRNWPAYEAGLRRRGSLTWWVEDAALESWQTTGPDRPVRYRDAAIQTSMMPRTAFKLALRPTEGLMTSVFTLLGLTLSAPDHSTVSHGAGILPVIQPASVPHGPLHVLIDSTGLQVYRAPQGRNAKSMTRRSRADSPCLESARRCSSLRAEGEATSMTVGAFQGIAASLRALQ
jgi:hypothetical protein